MRHIEDFDMDLTGLIVSKMLIDYFEKRTKEMRAEEHAPCRGLKELGDAEMARTMPVVQSGERVQKLRSTCGWSQCELARVANKSVITYYKSSEHFPA